MESSFDHDTTYQGMYMGIRKISKENEVAIIHKETGPEAGVVRGGCYGFAAGSHKPRWLVPSASPAASHVGSG